MMVGSERSGRFKAAGGTNAETRFPALLRFFSSQPAADSDTDLFTMVTDKDFQ